MMRTKIIAAILANLAALAFEVWAHFFDLSFSCSAVTDHNGNLPSMMPMECMRVSEISWLPTSIAIGLLI
jgi:hypothetical protein